MFKENWSDLMNKLKDIPMGKDFEGHVFYQLGWIVTHELYMCFFAAKFKQAVLHTSWVLSLWDNFTR